MDILNARRVLSDLKACAIEAGIYHAWFLAFGTLLGACRPSKRPHGETPIYVPGIILDDDDIDIGILSDRITAEQEEDYVRRVRERRLFTVRERFERRNDSGRLLWFTLRREKPPRGTKCCHWFWFNHGGFRWHSKGRSWINNPKLPSAKYPHGTDDSALCLGVPSGYLDRLYEIEFEGDRYNVPVQAGACLDLWYPNWITPQDVSSKQEYVLKVGRWDDAASWRIF